MMTSIPFFRVFKDVFRIGFGCSIGFFVGVLFRGRSDVYEVTTVLHGEGSAPPVQDGNTQKTLNKWQIKGV